MSGQSAIKNPRKIFSQSGGGTDAALTTRVTTLEDVTNKIFYFGSVSAASGAVTVPTAATILLDQLPAGQDAFVSTIVNSQPTGILPQTAEGVDITVTSFDSSGNYVLSGTPASFPVIILYLLSIKEKDKGNLTTANIIKDMTDNVGINEIALGTTNGVSSTVNLTYTGATGLKVAGLTGTSMVVLREWVTVGSNYAAIYLGNITPGATNYTLVNNGTLVRLNGGGGSGLSIDVGGDAKMTMGTAIVTFIGVNINLGAGKMAFGAVVPVSTDPFLLLQAGTATVAPVQFQAPGTGALKTSNDIPLELQVLTDKIYFTITTGTARKEITLNDAALTTGRVPSATTNGRLTDYSAHTYDGTNFAVLGTGSFGSGTKVMFLGDASAVPSTNPTAGVILYSENGIFKYRDVSGNIITV